MLETFKATGRGRKLASDDLNDEKKGFSWTVASFDRSGFKFKVTFNDEAYVSNGGDDSVGIKFLDSEKYLVGEDGTKVPITSVKIKMPKQMNAEDMSLLLTV